MILCKNKNVRDELTRMLLLFLRLSSKVNFSTFLPLLQPCRLDDDETKKFNSVDLRTRRILSHAPEDPNYYIIFSYNTSV